MHRFLCRLRGHRYGPPEPANPAWVLTEYCQGCNTVRVSMDRELLGKTFGVFIQVTEDGTETVLP